MTSEHVTGVYSQASFLDPAGSPPAWFFGCSCGVTGGPFDTDADARDGEDRHKTEGVVPERAAGLVSKANAEIMEARENPPRPDELRVQAAALRRGHVTRNIFGEIIDRVAPSPVELARADELSAWADKLESI